MAIDSEPSEPDMRTIRKTLRQGSPARGIVGWGGLALLALSALVLTSQTQSGNERLQQALSAVSSEPRTAVKIAEAAPAAVPEKSAETLRLEAQLQTLEADRDRLTARIATLERNLEDMTGSIRAQSAHAERAAAAPPPASAAPAAAPPSIGAPQTSLPHINLPQVNTNQVSMPQVSAPQASAAAAAVAPEPPAPAPSPAPAPQAAAPQAAAPQAASPLVDQVPMPPVRVAVARPPVSEAQPPRSSEYGIDLGGAPTGDALRARWAAVKANFGPMLNGLHPVAVRDRRPGSTELRLVVGPLPNAAAARDLCARVAAAYANCRPGRYDGESFVAR